MATRSAFLLLQRVALPTFQLQRGLHMRSKSTVVSAKLRSDLLNDPPKITSALPSQHHAAKVIFNDQKAADFKYIWLRDNCRCPQCLDPSTRQKLLDTANLNMAVRPESMDINEDGQLAITWTEGEAKHTSHYDSLWLFKYGQSFLHNTFETDPVDIESLPGRPDLELWDRTMIWANLPEISYNELMESDSGLCTWLEMFYKYGLAFLRGVPAEEKRITEVVKRFAYVKETQYGQIFDVISKPVEGLHLAYTGLKLAYHTDMNYREKSPGMQLLHCLKANDPKLSGTDPGGRSSFVDGFRVARWMEENEPAAFHVLTSTPVRFSIKNEGMKYSALWPIICTNADGDVTEIHHNNRTMQPLQAPTHVITPFYHAYKLFTDRMCEPQAGLEFHLIPGDLVAFNNRRVLHGRSAYDASKVDRHLQGCYVDVDEAFSKYDQLRAKTMTA